MTRPTASVQHSDLAARLERLELSRRRTRAGVLFAAVLALCVAAAAPDESLAEADEALAAEAAASADEVAEVAEVLRCRRLEVLDEQGAVIAAIGTDADGSTGLFVHDEAGRVRAAVIHDARQTGLLALDDEGTIRVGVVQFAHGGGGLALHGAKSVGASVLYHDGEAGELSFYDADGAVRASFPEQR